MTAEVSANWEAIAVSLLIASPAFAAVIRAFRAPAALQREFGDDRQRTRAAIEGNHLIPRLGELLIDLSVHDDRRRTREDRLTNLQNNLQSTEYLPALKELGELVREHSNLDALQSDARRWIRMKGAAAAVSLVGFAYPAVLWSVDGYAPPPWLAIPAYTFLALGTAFAVVFFVQETSARNRLSEIVRKYE